MTLRLITPPTTLPVTLEEAKSQCNVDHDESNALIEALIRAALGHVEQWCSRAFEPQTWEETFGAFPENAIGLTLTPIQSVVSVIYDDADGAEQTIDEADYDVDLAESGGRVIPIGSWPSAYDAFNAVRVQYVIGAGTPHDVKQAIRLIVGAWYDHRSDLSAENMSEIPMGSKAILNLHRKLFV